jgi:hypothetical protein
MFAQKPQPKQIDYLREQRLMRQQNGIYMVVLWITISDL